MYFCTVKRNICFFLRVPLCILMFFFGGVLPSFSDEERVAPSKDIDNVEISLLTCQPHDEVYSLYGHTAIRVHNKLTGDDIAVNYGVFDPTIDFFVLRFIFGLTDYSMGICSYQDFLDEYKRWGCGVYEQRINMNQRQKQAFMDALMRNARPENVVYRYNYFYNNCTTKARDIILEGVEIAPLTNNIGDTSAEVICKRLSPLQQGKRSFRDLVRMKTADHPWAQWGNDLLLGVAADANTTYGEREFLPEVLAADFDESRVVYHGSRWSKPLVDTAYWALQPGKPRKNPDDVNFPLSPFHVSLVALFVSIVFFILLECFVIKKPLLWVHYSVCCLYAFIGIFIFLMLFSQHPTVRVNFQILIFNPLFFIFALPKFMKGWGKYAILTSILLFFAGNILQTYAEGVNILALSLLITFAPFYFGKSKKNINFAS